MRLTSANIRKYNLASSKTFSVIRLEQVTNRLKNIDVPFQHKEKYFSEAIDSLTKKGLVEKGHTHVGMFVKKVWDVPKLKFSKRVKITDDNEVTFTINKDDLSNKNIKVQFSNTLYAWVNFETGKVNIWG